MNTQDPLSIENIHEEFLSPEFDENISSGNESEHNVSDNTDRESGSTKINGIITILRHYKYLFM